MSDRIERFSPLWLSTRLESVRIRTLETIRRTVLGSRAGRIAFLGCSVAGGIGLALLSARQVPLAMTTAGSSTPLWNGLLLFIALAVMLISAPLTVLCDARSRRILLPALSIAIVAIQHRFGLVRGSLGSHLAFLFSAWAGAALILIAARRLAERNPSLSLLRFQVLALTLLILVSLWLGNSGWLGPRAGAFPTYFIERLIFPLSLLVSDLTYLLSPALLTFPFPLDEKVVLDKEHSIERAFDGVLDGLFGTLALAVAYALRLTWIEDLRRSPGWTSSLAAAWLNAQFFLLYSFGVVRVATGVCRISGYPAEDGTDYAFLAVNPLDRWRRWNVYFYKWTWAFVFVPAYRKRQSVVLATLLVFFATFLLHQYSSIIGVILYPGARGVFPFHVRERGLEFFAHAVCVIAYFKTSNYWPDASTLRGWRGLLALQAMMTGVHALIY